MRQLAPTVRYEGVLLAEMAGTIGDVADVRAEVLLLGGAMKRPAFIKPAFEAIAPDAPAQPARPVPRPRPWRLRVT
jgi:hypothetical protein